MRVESLIEADDLAPGERWVTIRGNAVKINADGEIVAGPPALKGKDLDGEGGGNDGEKSKQPQAKAQFTITPWVTPRGNSSVAPRMGPDMNIIEGDVAGFPITTTERGLIEKVSKKTKAGIEAAFSDSETVEAMRDAGITHLRLTPHKGAGKPSQWTMAHSDGGLMFHTRTAEAIAKSPVIERQTGGIVRVIHHEAGHGLYDRASKELRDAFIESQQKHPEVTAQIAKIVNIKPPKDAWNYDEKSRAASEVHAELHAMRKYAPGRLAAMPRDLLSAADAISGTEARAKGRLPLHLKAKAPAWQKSSESTLRGSNTPSLEQLRTASEAKLQKILAGLDKRHRKQLEQAIADAGGVRNVPEIVWQQIQWEIEDETAAAIVLLMVAADEWTEDELRRQGVDGAELSTERRVNRYVSSALQQARDSAASTTMTTRARLSRKIEDMMLDPEGGMGTLTKPGIRKALDDVFTQSRRETQATDQTTGSFSTGQRGAAERLGGDGASTAAGQKVTIELRWQTELDDRVCPRCSPLHEQPEEVWGKVFPNGPGPEAHPNCRCFLKSVVVVEAVSESYRESDDGEGRWITLDSGAKVKITGDGTVLAGPPGFKGKNIKDVGKGGGKPAPSKAGEERGAKAVTKGSKFRKISPRARINVDQMADLMGERGYAVGKPEFSMKLGATLYPVEKDGKRLLLPAKVISKFLSTESPDIAEPQAKSGDGAVVNLPLDKRGGGSLNSQIDKWKADKAKTDKADRSTKSKQLKATKAVAKTLFTKHGVDVAKDVAAKKGLDAKAVHKQLDQWAKWEPDKLIKIMADRGLHD